MPSGWNRLSECGILTPHLFMAEQGCGLYGIFQADRKSCRKLWKTDRYAPFAASAIRGLSSAIFASGDFTLSVSTPSPIVMCTVNEMLPRWGSALVKRALLLCLLLKRILSICL